jgi:2-polyprenyl-3-methyl-5-hydroxy-6-metoxy-1,4-benzoquinol methylase
MKKIRVVKEHFDLISSKYEKNFSGEKSGNVYDFNTRRNLVNKILNGKSGNFLDCACGTGEITSKILDSGDFKNAYVCDISKDMLDIAKSRITDTSTKTKFINSDIFEFSPDQGVKFDVIICLGLIAHVGSLEELFIKLKKMLNPDGTIILQSSLLDHWGIKIIRLLTSKKYERQNGYKINYFTYKEILSYAQKSGLEIKNTMRYKFGVPFGDRLSRKVNYRLEVLMKGFSSKFGSECIFEIST